MVEVAGARSETAPRVRLLVASVSDTEVAGVVLSKGAVV